jgi:hypothetical protein
MQIPSQVDLASTDGQHWIYEYQCYAFLDLEICRYLNLLLNHNLLSLNLSVCDRMDLD